ncbi:hypothetical protein [Acrocarpospora sp. B8E8]
MLRHEAELLADLAAVLTKIQAPEVDLPCGDGQFAQQGPEQ